MRALRRGDDTRRARRARAPLPVAAGRVLGERAWLRVGGAARRAGSARGGLPARRVPAPHGAAAGGEGGAAGTRGGAAGGEGGAAGTRGGAGAAAGGEPSAARGDGREQSEHSMIVFLCAQLGFLYVQQ